MNNYLCLDNAWVIEDLRAVYEQSIGTGGEFEEHVQYLKVYITKINDRYLRICLCHQRCHAASERIAE